MQVETKEEVTSCRLAWGGAALFWQCRVTVNMNPLNKADEDSHVSNSADYHTADSWWVKETTAVAATLVQGSQWDLMTELSAEARLGWRKSLSGTPTRKQAG